MGQINKQAAQNGKIEEADKWQCGKMLMMSNMLKMQKYSQNNKQSIQKDSKS